MKYGVIDIGSNSVRLMISIDGITQYKQIKITKLAKGMDSCFNLSNDSIEKTADAVSFFVDKAKKEKVDGLYLFATAAVRKSSNKKEFLQAVYSRCKEKVDVITGELEAKIGFLGVFGYNDGGIIDIGGASSEIAVVKNGQEIYSKSLDIGAVNTTDLFKNNIEKTNCFVSEKVKNYGKVPLSNFSAVGGTATSLASVLLGLKEYDPKLVNDYIVKIENLNILIDNVSKMSLEQKENIVGLQKERADNFLSGLIILQNIMNYLSIHELRISEKDNLEGYLLYKMEKK